MAGEKFYFIFSEEPNKRVLIPEPEDYRAVDFNLDQKENGMGRDASLSGGEVKFMFREVHYLDKLLYYAHRYGFEADVKLVIVLATGDEFICEMDFYTAESDDHSYFSCSGIVESSEMIFKRRYETKVDLFSSSDIDGNYIEPLVPVNMLLQAKPSLQESKWKQYTPTDNFILGLPAVNYFNITQSIEESEVKNTLVPFLNRSQQRSDMQILEADSNLKNVTLSIKNIDIYSRLGSAGNVQLSLRYVKTIEAVNNSTPAGVTLFTQTSSSEYIYLPNSITPINIGNMQRGEKLYLYISASTNGSAKLYINSCEVSISTESTAYNTLVPSFRLIDVMKQVCKSISGLDVFAPRYNVSGQFYENVLVNGNLLRNVLDKPFYISWKDIENSIKGEHNADSEINLNKSVFVGIEDDFYTNVECGVFTAKPFEPMKRKVNPIYALNQFMFKYAKYQSLKENTEPNSDSTIHGESTLTFYNKKVENSKEVKIEWNRDAILLDVQQRLSTIVSKDTATQDDDTIFAIDTIATENDFSFTESTELQHTWDGTYLTLRSDGSVNFVVLGILATTNFVIEPTDPNLGNYEVFDVSPSEIRLIPQVFTPNTSNNGVRLTKYTYEIEKETVPLTNRTNQGFTSVVNLISPEKYSNLKYSVERNIRRFWGRFLATVNIYWKDKMIRNTYYKNNGQCILEDSELRTQEKEDFIPVNPIVTPYMYESVTLANVEFTDFLELQRQIRTYRGFIRIYDNNSRPTRLYPIKMSYVNGENSIVMSGQEKYEKSYLTISTAEPGIILINDETRVVTFLYDKIGEDKKLYLYDNEKRRLYDGVYWDTVTINGAVAESIVQLEDWLILIGTVK